jgi:hypothetical protein
MRTQATRAIAAMLLFAAGAGAAEAQNWEFTPRLQLGYLFNDNYRLDPPGDEIEVSGGLLDVTLPIRLVDPIRRAELAPRARATFFPDERDEDSTDYFLTGLFEQRSARQVFGVNGGVSREDVVRSELPTSSIDSNLGDPETGDSGRVIQRNSRDMVRVTPYWQYEVSERHRAEAGAHFFDANFEETFVGAQQDFQDYGVHAGWGYRMSQRSLVMGRVRASRYETLFESEAYGAEVELRADYSQTSHLYLRLGGQQTDVDRRNESAKTSVIAGAGGRWTWPTTSAFADLTRSVGPTSAGAVVERTQLRLRLDRAVRPRLSLFGGARGVRDEAVGDDVYPTREYLAGELGFDWRITRQWSVLGVYNYIWQEYSDEPSDAASNAVSLGIVYEPGRRE